MLEPSESISPLVFSLLEAQSHIGWSLFIEGCVHKDWQGIIDAYLKSLERKTTGQRWVSSLIKKLWQVAWDMWDHRNLSLHKEKENEALLGLNILKSEITDVHDVGIDALMTRDEKALFDTPLEKLLTQPEQLQRAWLDKANAAHAMCDARNFNCMHLERQLMRDWLEQAPA